MPRLSYNLDEIPDVIDVPNGRYRARLKKVRKYRSENSGEPVMEFSWKLRSKVAEIHGQPMRTWASLQDHALQSMKQHLIALGEKGKTDKDSDELLGRDVVLVVKKRKYKNKTTGEVSMVSSVLAVLPPDAPLKVEEVEDKTSEFEEDDEAPKKTKATKKAKPSKDDDEEDEKPEPEDDDEPEGQPENRKECKLYDDETFICGHKAGKKRRCKELYNVGKCPLAAKPKAKDNDDDEDDGLPPARKATKKGKKSDDEDPFD